MPLQRKLLVLPSLTEVLEHNAPKFINAAHLFQELAIDSDYYRIVPQLALLFERLRQRLKRIIDCSYYHGSSKKRTAHLHNAHVRSRRRKDKYVSARDPS